MTTLDLVLTVLACAAPLASVSGVFPFAIAFGGGWAPVAFFGAMVILALFATGIATMSKLVPNPGAFYAYITVGIGKSAGLGGAFLAIFAYWLITAASYAFLGSATQQLVHGSWGGPDIPWYVYTFAGLAIVTVLAYHNVAISAKVLSVVMMLEVLIIVIFDVAVGVQADKGAVSLPGLFGGALAPSDFPIAIVYALLCFIGFESTAIFREEARNPEKTVPRAMLLAVLTIGIFYVTSSFMLILAFGPEEALRMALNEPATMFPTALSTFVGPVASDIMSVLLVTSVFASLIALQNMLGRYMYSMGNDGVLPSQLGAAHPKHGSPYKAAIVTGLMIAALALVFFVDPSDPMKLYGQMVGAGTWALILLMVVAAAAVVIFFVRTPQPGTSAFKTKVAPILSFIGLALIIYFTTANLSLFTGLEGALAIGFIVVTVLVFTAGCLAAQRFRTKRPDVYARIGRQQG
ncbi:APC family permease [Arthrobacter sp. Alg241-R88]|uniref:APC family permease n=1 Tax=Arthrobacter sp. Alg241-R88 TaxID=2305984 RepID=UPI0013CFD091|nr:APC family permease [Arthrobacter sp. Alg241-R88]